VLEVLSVGLDEVGVGAEVEALDGPRVLVALAPQRERRGVVHVNLPLAVRTTACQGEGYP
jgi:hypothetical protein